MNINFHRTLGRHRHVLATVVAFAVAGQLYACAREPGDATAPSTHSFLVVDESKLATPTAPEQTALDRDVQALVDLQNRRSAADIERATYWNDHPVLRWNEIARGLVAKYYTSPPNATRVYAYLSVVQYETLVAVTRMRERIHARSPADVDPRIQPTLTPRDESMDAVAHAAIAVASAKVLGALYANKNEMEELDALALEHQGSQMIAGLGFPSDIAMGVAIGRTVAEQIVERANQDKSKRDIPWKGTLPTGPAIWHSSETPPVEPVRPEWRKVQPWFLTSAEQFRPPPPPALDSPEFSGAMDEIRSIARQRTPEQLRIAHFWADGPGTATPPGHWNEIAAQLIRERALPQIESARILAYLNMGLMDAGIACWEAKFHYWLLRPSHVDPTISLPIGLPNFPAYPSGHSTFSGAAAEILGYFFPDKRETFQTMAEEASMSRIYGAIHYKFDGVQGLEQGRKVGKLVIANMQRKENPEKK